MSKGQTEMFEYVIATFFIVLIIIVLIFMLASYQNDQLKLEADKFKDQRTEQLLKRILASPLLAKDDSVLDDAKLIAALSLCDDMKSFFGSNWYAVIAVMDSSGGAMRCSADEYSTECNTWVLCEENLEHKISMEGKGIEQTTYTVPLNVARKMGWVMRRGTATRVEPAIIEVYAYG